MNHVVDESCFLQGSSNKFLVDWVLRERRVLGGLFRNTSAGFQLAC